MIDLESFEWQGKLDVCQDCEATVEGCDRCADVESVSADYLKMLDSMERIWNVVKAACEEAEAAGFSNEQVKEDLGQMQVGVAFLAYLGTRMFRNQKKGAADDVSGAD